MFNIFHDGGASTIFAAYSLLLLFLEVLYLYYSWSNHDLTTLKTQRFLDSWYEKQKQEKNQQQQYNNYHQKFWKNRKFQIISCNIWITSKFKYMPYWNRYQ